MKHFGVGARGLLLPVIVAMALVLTQAPARAGTGARSAVPATPTLVVPLVQGIGADRHLSASQRAAVALDVEWLQLRLNIALPRLGWTAGPLRVDGVFDAKTTQGVKFFKTWANHARSLLHLSPLFATIDGVVGTSTEDIIAIVAAYFQQHPAPAPLRESTLQQQELAALNADRAAHHLQLLAPGAQLMDKAQAWSAHLAAVGALSHNSPTSGITSCFKVVSENVGAGPSIAQVEAAFILDANINPPVHRINIENGKFNLVGVGVTVRNGGYWIVQDFMQSC